MDADRLLIEYRQLKERQAERDEEKAAIKADYQAKIDYLDILFGNIDDQINSLRITIDQNVLGSETRLERDDALIERYELKNVVIQDAFTLDDWLREHGPKIRKPGVDKTKLNALVKVLADMEQTVPGTVIETVPHLRITLR